MSSDNVEVFGKYNEEVKKIGVIHKQLNDGELINAQAGMLELQYMLKEKIKRLGVRDDPAYYILDVAYQMISAKFAESMAETETKFQTYLSEIKTKANEIKESGVIESLKQNISGDLKDYFKQVDNLFNSHYHMNLTK